MTDRVQSILALLKSKEYRKQRRHVDETNFFEDHQKYLDPRVSCDTFRRVLALETPMFYGDDRFGFYQSTDLCVLALVGNVTIDYEKLLKGGFAPILETVKDSMAKTDDAEKKTYGACMLDSIGALLDYVEVYRAAAEQRGLIELAQALRRVPLHGAESFYEACVFMRLLAFFLRCGNVNHLTLGRFDQYMYPYFLNSRNAGSSDAELLELVEEFFLSLNFDTDLYSGIQQGDNGQSMVLGGYDLDGTDRYNDLSEMCLTASLELSLIDPKINLRVNKTTPLERFVFGTRLTKRGLGFPQYCNDDVVIPGLIKLGYEPADAANYTVAACWEYIIPGKGADVPNLNIMDFPRTVGGAVREHLTACATYEALEEYVEKAIAARCDEVIEQGSVYDEHRVPLLSACLTGTDKTLTDAAYGGVRYHNFGCHGVGISTGADLLAAVKKTVYEEKSVSAETLTAALDADFVGFEELRNRLLDCPKMGDNDDYVDSIAIFLMRTFGKHLNGRSNKRGGVWRAGTGSAMEYLRFGQLCPATPDGRKSGGCYGANFSPSLEARPAGLLSVIRSFTKYDMTDIINGGPLTLELHDTVLKNETGIEKTAMLVREFIRMGGHQLQLNSIDREKLLDAQKHPEAYPNLIVRVWGWSGYFNELDVGYQEHVIKRLEFQQ